MKKLRFDLAYKEQRILDLLWANPEGLTSVNLLEMEPELYPTPVYVHRAINSLIAKELIEECGSVKYNKQYARKFKASLSKEEFAAGLLTQKGIGFKYIGGIAKAFYKDYAVNVEDRATVLGELEQMIKDLKGSAR